MALSEDAVVSLTANLHALTIQLTKGDTDDAQLTSYPASTTTESGAATPLTSYPASSASRPSSSSSAPSLTASPLDQPKQLLPGAPVSPLFEIRDTPTAGRAVFASQNVEAGALLWRAEDLTLSVLLREYRREVCGQCFAYDYGRDLPFRDPAVGFVFCSQGCRDTWRREAGDLGLRAWTAVESLVKKRSREEDNMVDIDAPKPDEGAIKQAWIEAETQAELIRAARMAEQPRGDEQTPRITKQHRKAVQKALQAPIATDVLAFCAGGVLARHGTAPGRWEAVLSLAVDETPYISFKDLDAHVQTYLQLLAVLPAELLPQTTPETLRTLTSRDNHNAFGIRSLEDEGSEFFGYGCWPSASYFNHSCGPNVFKKRDSRVWEFRAGKDIAKGGEINITYLGGDEQSMSRDERRALLRRNWGFDCGCKRCQEL
ncbi:putative protein lysine methyltransferase [Colletotrichum sojae]|uniref:SET domain-containing protein n=1 Tax=Colletotrichum sojae TaxID=2175907 RepID=A0A8H6J4V2_9PEZI|nr:putative protein lysine methyltransferase [Colletotrichum sojae]